MLYLENGQQSLLRIIIVCLYDFFAVAYGIILLFKYRQAQVSIKTTVFSALTCCLAILASEGLLQVLVRIIPRIDLLMSGKTTSQFIPDERFRVVPNPQFPEHDSNGFRNPKALDKAEIVAVGDSFTYGTGVEPCQAWPYLLGRLSGQSVYNMSFGGYGGVEGLMLFERAIRMDPSVIVFATYNGNDLVEAYNAVYTRNLFPEFKTQNSSQKDAIAMLEQSDPLGVKITEITQLMWSGPNHQNSDIAVFSPKTSLWKMVKQLKLMRLFFTTENALQKTFVDTPAYRYKKEKKNNNNKLYEVFDAQNFKTLFTPAYRRIAMNLDDIRIEEGLDISLQAIKRMSEMSQSNSIHCLILLIPTKERVFYELYPEYNMKPSESMSWLIKEEEQIRSRTMSFLEENHISYIDLLPILRNCFKSGQQPYFMDSDGHFNATGQAAVAEAVCQYINRLSSQGQK
jgi:lysophospholipase L1-like esterase